MAVDDYTKTFKYLVKKVARLEDALAVTNAEGFYLVPEKFTEKLKLVLNSTFYDRSNGNYEKALEDIMSIVNTLVKDMHKEAKKDLLIVMQEERAKGEI